MLSDWLWYVLLPLVSYLTLVVAAILLPAQAVPALFITAAVMLLLLFMGICNAWDVVTYTTLSHVPRVAQRDGISRELALSLTLTRGHLSGLQSRPSSCKQPDEA